MKKLIIMLLSCFMLTGCSLIPRITFDSPNSVPQSVDKSKAKESCKGKAKWDENGNIISCSKGYYNYTQGYVKKERKYTITEKVRNIFNTIFGWGIWGLIIILVLCPSAFTLVGTFIGRFIEGSIGITGKALKATIKGIQKARKEGKDLNDALDAEEDNDVKKHIRKLKEKENIK